MSRLRLREELSGSVQPKPIGRVRYRNRINGKVVYGSWINDSGSLSLEERRTWDYLNPGPPFQGGGTFLSYLYKRPLLNIGATSVRASNYFVGGPDSPFTGSGHTWEYFYEGGFSNPLEYSYGDSFYAATCVVDPETKTYSSTYPDDLSSLGATAYAKLRPKVEKVNLFQTIVESREIPRMLKTTSRGFRDVYRTMGGNMSVDEMPKKLGDHFLNVQFGWKPFLRDLDGIVETYHKSDVFIDRLLRENNTVLKRRWHEDDITSDTLLRRDTGLGYLPCTPLLGSSGENSYLKPASVTYEIRQKKLTRRWYTGRFKVYRGEFDSSLLGGSPRLERIEQLRSLYGLRVSPASVYKVVPWTWLVDWFVDVSGRIQTLEDLATNRVVAESMCAMRTIHSITEYKITAPLAVGGTLELIWTRGVESKNRECSLDPFGFSLTAPSLSASQVAILAALGLSNL